MSDYEKFRFEIPEVGSFTVCINDFKLTPPFSHYTPKQKQKHIEERNKMKKYTVFCNGGGIGGIDKLEDSYDIIREWAENHLHSRRKKLKDELDKIDEVVKISEEEFDWIQLFRKG